MFIVTFAHTQERVETEIDTHGQPVRRRKK